MNNVEINVKVILAEVYKDLCEGGYDITNHNGARTKLASIDREQLFAELVRSYLDI